MDFKQSSIAEFAYTQGSFTGKQPLFDIDKDANMKAEDVKNFI